MKVSEGQKVGNRIVISVEPEKVTLLCDRGHITTLPALYYGSDRTRCRKCSDEDLLKLSNKEAARILKEMEDRFVY